MVTSYGSRPATSTRNAIFYSGIILIVAKLIGLVRGCLAHKTRAVPVSAGPLILGPLFLTSIRI
jgi:hypothetical protein